MDSQQPAVSSFVTRMTNVFTAPSELFAELASAPPQTTSWLVPLCFSILIAVVFTYSLFSNQSLRDQMFEPRIQDMQEQVEKGKMTQEQADRAKEFMASSSIVMFTGLVGAVIAPLAVLFGGALVLWATAKLILKGNPSYKKMLEMFGLSSLIGVLGSIITLLLMHAFDTIHASPGGSLLLLGSYDRHNTAHKLVASVTVFGLWQTALIGLGFSQISGKAVRTGMGVAFGLWAVFVVFSGLTGWGIM